MVNPTRATLVVAALALLAACGVLRVPPPLPGAPVVLEVEIVGARQVDPNAIRARLGTAGTGRWPWDAPRRFDPVVWADDLVRIPLIYRAEGFYSARVASSEVRERRDGVIPTVVVREGAPTRTVEVELRGIEDLPSSVRDDVRAAVALPIGVPFRELDWNATKQGILGTLRRSGYATAELDAEARVDPDAHRARAALDVRPGERYRFGAVQVVTPVPFGVGPEAVVEEARAAVARDAWYDPAALAEAQARVFRMGLFSAVEVAAGEPDPRTRRVPVSIAVRGAPPQALSLGAGVGITLQQDDVHATAEWVARGVAEGLATLRVRGNAGYALVPPIQEALGAFDRFPPRRGPFARIVADADVPRPLGATAVHLFASTELDLVLREAYRSTEVRPSLGAAWSPVPTLQLQTEYRFVAANLFDTPLTSDPTRPAAFGCAYPCTLSGLDLSATWDTHRLSRPQEGGWHARARLRYRGTLLAGGYDLLSAVGEVSTDQPLSTGQTLFGRVGVGTAFPTGGGRPVPVLERLSGGGGTMRGYGAGRLSPLMPARVGGGPLAVPVGGGGLLEGTLELRQPLGQRVSLIGFADVGAVSVGRFAPGPLLSALHWAVGGGLRVDTPIGPLGVELAYRLPLGPSLPIVASPAGDRLAPPTGCFGFGRGSLHGGGPDSPCRIQISLGEVR